jgi:hypothetical protein
MGKRKKEKHGPSRGPRPDPLCPAWRPRAIRHLVTGPSLLSWTAYYCRIAALSITCRRLVDYAIFCGPRFFVRLCSNCGLFSGLHSVCSIWVTVSGCGFGFGFGISLSFQSSCSCLYSRYLHFPSCISSVVPLRCIGPRVSDNTTARQTLDSRKQSPVPYQLETTKLEPSPTALSPGDRQPTCYNCIYIEGRDEREEAAHT